MTSPIDPLVVGVAITAGDDTGPFPAQPKPPAERKLLPSPRRTSSDAPPERYPAPAVTAQQAHAAGGVQEKMPVRPADGRKEERLAQFAARIGAGDHDVAALASPFQDGRYPR
jgi:hypothetical protein